MKKLLVIFISLLPNILMAQDEPAPHFIIMQSGYRVEGVNLVYEDHILADPIFKLDGTTYATPEIKFLSNNNGYFANLAPIHGEKSERYALRIVKGKLDLYEEIDMMIYGQPSLAVMIAIFEPIGFATAGGDAQHEAANIGVPNSEFAVGGRDGCVNQPKRDAGAQAVH